MNLVILNLIWLDLNVNLIYSTYFIVLLSTWQFCGSNAKFIVWFKREKLLVDFRLLVSSSQPWQNRFYHAVQTVLIKLFNKYSKPWPDLMYYTWKKHNIHKCAQNEKANELFVTYQLRLSRASPKIRQRLAVSPDDNLFWKHVLHSKCKMLFVNILNQTDIA